MKESTINIRTSEEDEVNLQKASENLSILTDKKPSISKTIREGVKLLAEQDPNKPILYYVDRRSLQALDRNIEFGQKALELFIAEFFTVTGQYCTMDELQTMFEGLFKLGSNQILQTAIKECIIQKLYDKLKADHPDFTFTIDNVPAKDLTRLFELSGEVGNVPSVNIRYRDQFFWNAYQVNQGIVTVIPEALESIRNNYRLYAVTPEEKKKLREVQQLCEKLNAFLADKDVPLDQFSSAMVTYYDPDTGMFQPSGGYIRYPLKKQVHFEH